MISILFILIVLLGIIFTVMTYANPAGEDFEITWPVIAMITWFIAAIFAFNIEQQVNVVSSAGTVTTALVSYAEGWPLSLLFMLLAFVCIIFVWFRVMDRFKSVAR